MITSLSASVADPLFYPDAIPLLLTGSEGKKRTSTTLPEALVVFSTVPELLFYPDAITVLLTRYEGKKSTSTTLRCFTQFLTRLAQGRVSTGHAGLDCRLKGRHHEMDLLTYIHVCSIRFLRAGWISPRLAGSA